MCTPARAPISILDGAPVSRNRVPKVGVFILLINHGVRELARTDIYTGLT